MIRSQVCDVKPKGKTAADSAQLMVGGPLFAWVGCLWATEWWSGGVVEWAVIRELRELFPF